MSEVKTRARALLQEAAPASTEAIGAGLRDLGLTGYAADAFCSLARVSEATAGDLVSRTGIPDSKIYYALDELAEKGLVEVQAGKPKTYRAIPAREAEGRLARPLEEKHDRERATVKRVASPLEPLRAAARSPITDLAYIVKGLPNVTARARSMIGSARKEIVLLASDVPLFLRDPGCRRSAGPHYHKVIEGLRLWDYVDGRDARRTRLGVLGEPSVLRRRLNERKIPPPVVDSG